MYAPHHDGINGKHWLYLLDRPNVRAPGTGACATFGMRCMGRDGRACSVQNRRPPRLMGCFVPRRLDSPRLEPSSLSSPPRSCPLVLDLLFGRGEESESDEGTFEGTLLRATEACARDPGTDGSGLLLLLLVRETGLLCAAVGVERNASFPFPGGPRGSVEMLRSSSSPPAPVGGLPVVAWPRAPVPGPCRVMVAFVGSTSPGPIFTCYLFDKIISSAALDGPLTRESGDSARPKLVDGSWGVGVLVGGALWLPAAESREGRVSSGV